MRKQYWYIELKSHIETVHRLQYKTILITGIYLYQVVTKCNVLVIKLWIDHVNELRKEPLKLGWLTLQKQYRRKVDAELHTLNPQ